jgi:hypothetical protein
VPNVLPDNPSPTLFLAFPGSLAGSNQIREGLATRTKPQAPRSLQQWLASSFEAGKQAYAEAAMTNPSEFGELET